MNDCTKPLDPLDCEALASEEGPSSFAAEAADSGTAAAHAASCPACTKAVADARLLLAELDRVLEVQPAGSRPIGNASSTADLASRIIRIRPFSRREHRDLRIWAGPVGFSGLLFATGLAVLASPGLGSREQAGLAFGALAPLLGLFRAVMRAIADAATAPAAWQALSDVARRDAPLGFAALLLLAPAGFALRRVLARAGRRG